MKGEQLYSDLQIEIGNIVVSVPYPLYFRSICRRSKNRCKVTYKGSGVFRSSGCRSQARDPKRAPVRVLLLLLRDDYGHYTTILLATPCHPRQKITLACFRLGIVLGGPDIGLTATAVNGDAPVMCEMVCYRRFVYYSESILAFIDTFTPGNH